MTIEHLRTREKPESIREAVSSIEAQYSSQLQLLSENRLKQELKHEETIKLLSLELKSEKEKLIQLQHKAPSVLQPSSRNEKRFELEVERVREEKEAALAQQQQTHFAEKEALRSKIRALEERAAELERARAFALFEQEKSQAKW